MANVNIQHHYSAVYSSELLAAVSMKALKFNCV